MDQGQALVSEERDIAVALKGAGLIGPGAVAFEPLAGGVSCDVWRVEGLAGPLVVKRPLEKLRVAADWHAPLARRASEVNWLRLARTVDPDMAPEVLADFPALDVFVLRYLPGCPVWKDVLSTRRVDVDFAAALGRKIVAVHARTAGDDDVRVRFADIEMFRALRIDPFLHHSAAQNVAVAGPLKALAEGLESTRIALVHGDISPKNILMGPDGPVLLDAECAVYGDPAFDLAFCTTHLLLKAVWLDMPILQDAAMAMITAYANGIDWEPATSVLDRAGALTAALLLARIEGKSPAPYLVDPLHKKTIRHQAMERLVQPHAINVLVDQWKRTLA